MAGANSPSAAAGAGPEGGGGGSGTPGGAAGAASASDESGKRKPAAFLGLGSSSYDGRHSEGNRFIIDKHL